MRRRKDPLWMRATVEIIARTFYFAVGFLIAFYIISYLWPRAGTFSTIQLVLIWGLWLVSGITAAIVGPRIFQKHVMKNRGNLENIREKSGLPKHSRVGHREIKIVIPLPENKDQDLKE